MDVSIIPSTHQSRPSSSKNWNPESGHSHVMGVLLLITIVMIMGGVVTLIVASQPLPDKVPIAYMGIARSGDGVELINRAGDTLTRSSVMIFVDGIDRTAEFRSGESTSGWGTLKAGERIIYKSENKPESVQVVYAGNSGKYLLASSESTISGPVKIVNAPTISAQSGPSGDVAVAEAVAVSTTIPPVMNINRSYPVSVTMKNTGNILWNAESGVCLGGIGEESGVAAKFSPTRICIPATTEVLPGAQYTFNFTMTAPAIPGSYSPQYKMVRNQNQWFGALLSPTIQVERVPVVDALLLSSTIPASMSTNQSYPVLVTMKNTGSMTWNKGSMISLGVVGSDDELERVQGADDTRAPSPKFSPTRICIPAGNEVLPGAQYAFNFTMTAPATPGTYTPQYKMVWDGHQWFGSLVSRTIQVANPADLPHAQFTSNATKGPSPLFVQFTDKSTGTAPMTYHWDFQDGEGNLPENSQQNPVWRFWEDAGTVYTVTLTVTNAYGSDTITKQNYIMLGDTLSSAPVAAFTSSVERGTAPLTVLFTDQSVGRAPMSYAWDFNNDRIIDSTINSPSFTYTTAGNYTVNLTVTNEDGSDSEVKQRYIRVTSAIPQPTPTLTPSPTPTPTITPAKLPAAQFTANTTQGKYPLAVQFTDLSGSAGTSMYAWDINNDGKTDYTIKNPVHTYQTAGTYSVRLTVTNASGSDSEIKTEFITVVSPVITGDCYGAEACNPTGNPIGGGSGYSRIITGTEANVKYVVSTKAELLTALKSARAGEVVFVKGTAVIDMTGTPSVTIPSGVTLASDRGRAGSAGALLRRTKNLNGGWEEPMFIAGGDNIRVTGLRLEGEGYPQDYGNGEVYPGSINERYYLVGIYAENRKGFEVDNCEMYGWAWSCVSLRQNSLAPIPSIHHNYIHHNQARGEGYGINLYGGNALIEANIFDYNRHAITGAGHAGEKYEARYNIVLGNGDAIGGHHFDVHQDEDGGDFAGDKFLIHHNTFRKATDGGGILASVAIRQRPTTGAYIYNNLFEAISTETENGMPIWERDSDQNMFATNNKWMGKLYPTNSGIVWFI